MKPSDVTPILDAIFGGHPWYLAVLLAAVASSIAAYFGSYLGEKAKSRALQESVDSLIAQARQTTQATEAIKVQIAGGLWVEQGRWNLKRETYQGVLEALGEFAWSKRALGPLSANDCRERLRNLTTALVRAYSFGRIVLSSGSVEGIGIFIEVLDLGRYSDEEVEATYNMAMERAHRTFHRLAEEAAADLMALNTAPESRPAGSQPEIDDSKSSAQAQMKNAPRRRTRTRTQGKGKSKSRGPNF